MAKLQSDRYERGYFHKIWMEYDCLGEHRVSETLKVLSATFLLVCFVSLKKSTCEMRKNVFYFTSKALFVLVIINFNFFKYSNVMTSSNA